MKLKLAESGPPVEAPIVLGIAFAVDVLFALALLRLALIEGTSGGFRGSPWAPWAVAAYAVALVALDFVVARMKPTALTWRRRLGYLAIVAIAWNSGPFSGLSRLAVVGVIVWVGFTWIALVLTGRALSRAIAGATGEDKPE